MMQHPAPQPAQQAPDVLRRGRPALEVKRPMLSMRIDPDVLAALRASGPGWQTRLNAALRTLVQDGRL